MLYEVITVTCINGHFCCNIIIIVMYRGYCMKVFISWSGRDSVVGEFGSGWECHRITSYNVCYTKLLRKEDLWVFRVHGDSL